MSSGATTSAGRAKRDGGRCLESVVAVEIQDLGRDLHPINQNYQDI